MVMNNSDYNCP